jgi:hypothetical protein
MYELTIFKNRFDNKTHRRQKLSDWNGFVKLLYQLSRVSKTGKKDAELISPATYTDGTTRSNDNVEYWGNWAAVDVDDFETYGGDLESILVSSLFQYDYVCYSTASSTSDNPKFRLVFNLTRRVEKDEIKSFWYALNTELGEIGDRQTKDLSRMYYIPAQYAGANNFIFRNSGNPIDVDYLIAKHPYKEREGNNFLDRLPPELQKAVLEHRKESMNNTNVSWTDYRDCPFFPKQLAAEYRTITQTGWYHKMYQIMVATAANAIKRGYPITAKQIADLCRQFDNETGMWYTNRPLEKEADRAVEYAYRNV